MQLGFPDVAQLRLALNPYREKKIRKNSQKKYNAKARIDNGQEHTIKNSTSFLNYGTQLCSLHNDYCQHFIDTGQRPQNFIRDVQLTNRFEEYPKLKELVNLKV